MSLLQFLSILAFNLYPCFSQSPTLNSFPRHVKKSFEQSKGLRAVTVEKQSHWLVALRRSASVKLTKPMRRFIQPRQTSGQEARLPTSGIPNERFEHNPKRNANRHLRMSKRSSARIGANQSWIKVGLLAWTHGRPT